MERFNVYHRKDGRWEGRILRGKRKNGRRKYQYFFGRSREQVHHKMKEVRSSELTADCSVTVRSLSEEWLASSKYRVRESTLANYRLKLDKHILPWFGTDCLSSINPEDIYKFIDKKQKDGLSNRYITDILIVMKSVFKYAVNHYHIFNSMTRITIPKKINTEIKLLDAPLSRFSAK